MMNVKSILIHHGYIDKVIGIDLMYITGETLTLYITRDTLIYIACHLLVFYSLLYNKKLCPPSTPKKINTHTQNKTKTKLTKQNKEKLKQKTKKRKRWRHICGFDMTYIHSSDVIVFVYRVTI